MKSVAIFNNKGGVGKTTLLCHLASSLAVHHSRSVLVIDADPQCNATQHMFSDDAIEAIYGGSAFTVQTIVKPLSEGRGFAKQIVPRMSERFRVHVVPGDPALSLSEDLLANDWIQGIGGDVRGLRTTLLFKKVLEKCLDFDFVFFDVGPTLGAINRAVLIGSDYFIVPMSIDIFSLRAIDNISVQLNKWRSRFERAISDLTKDEIASLEVGDPNWRLEFLGYLSQQYKMKTVRGQRRAVNAYEKIMKQVPERIQERLIDDMGGEGVAEAMELGAIPLLHSLIPMAQSARAPIFDLRAADGVRGAHFARVKEFDVLIREISSRFLEAIEAND